MREGWRGNLGLADMEVKLDLWVAVSHSVVSAPGSTKHPSRKAQEPELSGLGRSAARDGSCRCSEGGGRRRAARRPGAGGAQVQVPCADPGVGAAVTLVCLPSRGRRAPPGEGSVFALQGPSPLP